VLIMNKRCLGGMHVPVEYLQSKYSLGANVVFLIGVIGCLF